MSKKIILEKKINNTLFDQYVRRAIIDNFYHRTILHKGITANFLG